jgi:protoporphyrinogen oxidase
MPETIVIVGGGVSALLAALLTRRERPHADIHVVEQSPELGGLLRKIDAGPFGSFDCGMHTMTETGIADLDALLRGLLPEDKWHNFGGRERDLSGIVFQGRLQHNAHHVDLRLLGEERYRACLADFFVNLQNPLEPSADNLHDWTRHRFGPRIADEVFAPVVRKTYLKEPREIDVMAGQLLPFDRVVLVNEAMSREFLGSPLLRGRLAFAEQRRLPLEYSSGRGSYYPRDFGIYRVIEAIAERLRQSGVTIHLRTALTALERNHDRISAVRLQGQGGPFEIDAPADVFWTVGVPPLAKHLGAFPADCGFDATMRTVIVNLLLDRPPDMGDLYYFYCFDEAHPSYRITNYNNYCPGAARAGGYPLCVELVLDPALLHDVAAMEALALGELSSFGIIPAGTGVLHMSVLPLAMGFPMLTCRNVGNMSRLREAVAGLGLRNLSMYGILSQPGLFFQTDIFADTYRRVLNRYHGEARKAA